MTFGHSHCKALKQERAASFVEFVKGCRELEEKLVSGIQRSFGSA